LESTEIVFGQERSPIMKDLVPGEILKGRVAGYKTVRKLNDGGAQGVVYVAEERCNGSPCAVKVLRRGLSDRERIRLEYLIGCDLPSHDKRLLGSVDMIDSPAAVVCPLAQNVVSLGDFTSKNHDLIDALRIVEQLVVLHEALEAAGLEQGDVSYENILIGCSPGREAFLVDFGAYNCNNPRIPHSNVSGTPPFVDPAREYSRDWGIGGDVFSLMLLVLEMLTGRLPLPTDSMENYFSSLGKPGLLGDLHAIYPELAPMQCVFASRCLSYRRAERPAMAEIAREFSHIASRYHVCVHCGEVFYLDRSRCGCPFCGQPNRLLLHLNGTAFDLRPLEISVGRSSSCNIALKYYPGGDTVSSQHALITRYGTKYSAKDLGSTNGTFVNGARLAPNIPHPLKPGDVVKLGEVEMRVGILGK
jgi:hypothetical protein